jgi:HEAT repeat protein
MAACIAIALNACSSGLFSPSRSANPEIEQTVDKLIQPLADPEGEDRATAIGGLVALGPQAPEALARGLENPDGDIRLGIVEALGQMPADTAVPLLIGALDDEDWEVRLAIVEALGVFRDRRAVGPLMKRFAVDDDDQVRYECLTSLGLIGDPAAVDLLVKGTSDHNPYVRMWAMEALCQMRDPHAESLALELLEDPDENVRTLVLASCANALDTPHGNARLIDIALNADRFQGSVVARRFLVEHVQAAAPDSELRQQIRDAGLAALHGSQALGAALLLADIGDPSGKDQLVVALHDPNLLVRHHAAHLLGRIGDPTAVPPLIEALKDEPLVAATAFDSLQKFAQDGDQRARAAVAAYTGERFSARILK